VLVPVVAALLVWVNVTKSDEATDHSGHTGAAEVEGAPSQREDLPVLPVAVPPVTPEAEVSCPAVMSALPLELTGEPSRRVQSDSPFAYAWGEPPTVLVCGVDRPEGFTVSSGLIQINGVQWFVDTSDPDVTVWTAVDRPVYVEVQVPATSDSAAVTELTVPIAQNLDRRDPEPAG